jgi:hypothetical protein
MKLIDCLGAELCSEKFDATDVWARAKRNPLLTAALDAEVPGIRYKSGHKKGEMSVHAIRMALRSLPGLAKRYNQRSDY